MQKSHLLKQTTFVALIALTTSLASAQSTDEDAIKKALQAETEAFFSLNADAWQAAWLHDANVTRADVANNSYSTIKGWDSFGPALVNQIKQAAKQGKAAPVSVTSDNYVIRVDGNLAWAEYDQHLTGSNNGTAATNFAHEYRTLVKQDGAWKIGNLIHHEPDTFKPGGQNVEASLNRSGYTLIEQKKIKEAIEVLKLNVQLNPTSANCYDSLGEAYALNGQTRKAIKNYEKAIALDPSRDGSKAALAKLKKQ
jgi:tetratricopeptide (TPR) repeat protein